MITFIRNNVKITGMYKKDVRNRFKTKKRTNIINPKYLVKKYTHIYHL